MSQYKTGTVAITNGSATVTGTGTAWLANVSAGQFFGVDGDGVFYTVASVVSDTSLTLSANYGGTTGSGKTYSIVRDYTSPDSIPLLSANDIQTAAVFARAMTRVQELFLAGSRGLFRKDNPTIVAFAKTGAFAASTATALYIEVNGTIKTIVASTAIAMPGSPIAGTDYAIWAKTNGTLEATNDHATPPTANARKIGGFHYAPGGNAPAQSGGDTTPAINAYSFWDLKFRPACPDPRGMALVADGFWSCIYLLGVEHLTNGPSKYNVTIADGSSPPKIPTKFGGNGTTAYADGNWWNMHEALRSHGLRFPTYSEFAALAYGTTEAASATAGTDPVSTILRAESTSKWGMLLSTGNLWVWGDEFGGGAAGAGWTANTQGRGSTYQMENAVPFGGYWSDGVNAGSRCSNWSNSPAYSSGIIGARGVCGHLILD